MGLRIQKAVNKQNSRIKTALALNKKGECLFAAGKIEEASLTFREAIKLHPKFARAKSNFSVLLWHTSKIAEAVLHICDALRLDPDDPLITLNCGKILESLEKSEKAKELYLLYLKRKHDEEIAQALADLERSESQSPTIETISGILHEKKQVVFVSDMPRSREAKIAYGLKHAGWDVILLHNYVPTFDATKFCAEVHQYTTPQEALDLAISYSPVVYHVFSNWNFGVATTLIRNKPGKIIFDDYDVMAGMVKEKIACPQYPGQMELEHFCLENADGLCCRSLETKYAKRKMGYTYSMRRIFFPDYCWNNYRSIQKDTLDHFAVANIGNLYIDQNYDINHPKNYHLKLAIMLSRQNIQSYLYKTFLTDETIHFVKEVTGDNPFISVKNLGYDAMINEISQLCHAGLICTPQHITSNPDEIYCQVKRDLAIGNKAFDYVDAGMPIIMDSENKFLFWLLERYHKVFDFNVFIADVNKHVELIHEYTKNNSEERYHSRNALSIRHHIQRLTRFYESL